MEGAVPVRVICTKIPWELNRVCNPGKYPECENCGLYVTCKYMNEGVKEMEEKNEVFVTDSQGSLVTEVVELPDSKVLPTTSAEQLLEFLKRALGHNPLEIRVRVGHPVEILRPIAPMELLANNPELIGIAKTMVQTGP